MVQKLLSYLFPINIHTQNSEINKSLEVTWNNGALVLDSKNTNYSYGSLQRALKKGLRFIGFERIKNFDQVLVLGVAGGSVIKTIRNDIKHTAKITAVDIDKHVLEIAKKYFNLETILNLEIVEEDAFKYVLKSNEKFDLIIIDIFQDTHMPSFLFEDFFIHNITKRLSINGFILFNTMVLSFADRRRNATYKQKFDSNYSVRMYPKIENHNEIFTIKKLA
ncbi:MAG TPA: spermidine synthase [Flavobacterium sp.]|nr:spermidine synthase [Flavobacterium sp.]